MIHLTSNNESQFYMTVTHPRHATTCPKPNLTAMSCESWITTHPNSKKFFGRGRLPHLPWSHGHVQIHICPAIWAAIRFKERHSGQSGYQSLPRFARSALIIFHLCKPRTLAQLNSRRFHLVIGKNGESAASDGSDREREEKRGRHSLMSGPLSRQAGVYSK